MADTVVLPRSGTMRRHHGPFIPPLMIVPFLLYNLVAFLFFGGRPDFWSQPVFHFNMVSGTPWVISWADVMLIVGLVCLFVEILKSTRTGTASVLEHMLSTVVFVLFLIEFLLVGAAASSAFFLLMMMSLIDLVAGFTVSITSAGRDVTMMNN